MSRMALMGSGGGSGRTLISFSFSKNLLSSSLFRYSKVPIFRKSVVCVSTTVDPQQDSLPPRHSLLLDKLRSRHLKDAAKNPPPRKSVHSTAQIRSEASETKKAGRDEKRVCSDFSELGLNEDLMAAIEEMGISVPTEIQCVGIPAVLEGKSVVLGSHTGSGKTLTYMLPLVQLIKRDEEELGVPMKARRPRAVVMCPTRELSEQVFRVAKSISHHARFRSTMISGGGRLRPQEDSLNVPLDMIVGTPGRILQHINDGNIVYGDIKYLVLDEADTMFDRGFGPDIKKFLAPLKNRSLKPGDHGFQTVLVAATMTKAVQTLIDEEFQGIVHLRTSTFNKKVALARHDFIKLSGSENKLEVLLQVLEPSLAKGNRVMVFCNTLNSSRAVDHFLGENQIFTVNYHGEVPAEQRVENLKKFKSDEGDCPTLVCTDLAARGLDMDVDHVIMFDFPSNSIDYLHRTGRTARMGAKGKVTSLVAKKDLTLATRIEDAIQRNESLETINGDIVRKDPIKKQTDQSVSSKSRSPPKFSLPTVRSGSVRSISAVKLRKTGDAVNRNPTMRKTGDAVDHNPRTMRKSGNAVDRNPRMTRKTGNAVDRNPSTIRKKVEKPFEGQRKTSTVVRRKATSAVPKAAGGKIKVVGFRRSSAAVNEGGR